MLLNLRHKRNRTWNKRKAVKISSHIQKLIDELTDDPLGRGYSSMTDKQVAQSLRAEDRPRKFVFGFEIGNVTHGPEFRDLTEVQQQLWLTLCMIERVDLNSGVGQGLKNDLFLQNSTTKNNLTILQNAGRSRLDELNIKAPVYAKTINEVRQQL